MLPIQAKSGLESDMNAPLDAHTLPPANDFIAAMWCKVQNAYPRVMSIVATAIVQAGGDKDAIVRMAGNKASRAAFLMGCCAEELVSSGFEMKGRQAKRYVREMIEALCPLVRPMKSKRVAPDFRRLMMEYGQHPVRMRAKTVKYMLAVSGLEREQIIVSENASCQLQVECSVTVDGVTGCLVELMMQHESPTKKTTGSNLLSEELGPEIASTLRRLD